MKTTDLTDLIADLAGSAVRTQEQLDEAFEQEKKRFEALLAITPAEWRPYLRTAAPNRQLISKYEVSARLRLQQEKNIGAGVSIGVQMMNFSADLRFQRDTSRDCQLTICIEQVPVPLAFLDKKKSK